MRFFIEDLEVFFPYSYIYPEQYYYMVKLKKCLDAKGACVLEMPSGTGKTVTLLSLITSYQAQYPGVGKLVYCTRTVSEIEKVLEEMRRVYAFRFQEGHPPPINGKWLCLGLSSRRNMCVHPRVGSLKDASSTDSQCRNLTATWVREQAQRDSAVELCDFYENFEKTGRDAILNGVYSIEDIREFGREKTWCPYFLARHMINFANVVVFSYQYIIDPKISDLVSKEFKKNSIVVFDEAHNIDNVCIDALSVNITRQTLDASTRNINTLTKTVKEVKTKDSDMLMAEYKKLVDGLAQTGQNAITDRIRAEPVLTPDVVDEAVPGNIRKAEHFVRFMQRFTEYLKTRLRSTSVISESPLVFLQGLYNATSIEAKTLRFASSRLNSLLYSLQLKDVEQYTPLSIVADFGTLIGTYAKGFILIIDPQGTNHGMYGTLPTLQFCCLDASLAMRPVLSKFASIVITSGTISPLDMYTRILDFKPVAEERFPMTLTRDVVSPIIITRGSDQVAMTSRFDVRNDLAVVRNYGDLLVEMSACVPDGIVCFFTSYIYMEEIISMWNEMGILNQALAHKLLFVETPDVAETSLALENYRKACDNGRGAILFSVARGKVSEGIDFDNHYGRAVILFGIPYLNTQSRVLKARLEFLRDNYQVKEGEFLTFDAMRTAAQCVGRVIRGKTDYGLMIFADKRFNRMDKREKLPVWISNFMKNENLNLSTDMALGVARKFLTAMTQPYTREEQLGTSLWTIDDLVARRFAPPYSTMPLPDANAKDASKDANNNRP
eukprot:TRINITY_DN3266_c0_g1_i1.p1 TRINITY_DN3266_c0_g1~~TRINITY_DN3266_c0_g1_i1.p1  ORF type:complete len:778 (+),score=213.38 TRINITY_DN3266_c0_g1_i1:151-2484(+)